MSEWKEYKLGEIALINMGQSPNSESYNFDNIGLPFFQGNRTFGRLYPLIDTYCSSPNKIAEKDDILFSVRAPVGDINYSPEKVCIGRGLCSIRMKNGNQKFLFYLLNYVKQDIINKESGTVFGSVNKSILEGLKVKIPNLPTQTAIAEILSSLDDKIELNNKINQELETLAYTLFKKWFIDFEFPNENGEPYKSSGGEMVDSELGEIPKGWSIISLKDVLSLKNGYAFKGMDFIENGIPVIKIKNVKSAKINFNNLSYVSENVALKAEKFKIKKFDLLITMSGNRIDGSIDTWVGKVGMFPKNGEYLLNQRVSILNLNNIRLRYFLLQLLSSEEFQYYFISNATSSGGQANISPDLIYKTQILLPETNKIEIFDGVANDIYSTIFNNMSENESLIKLRDTLLPKLISGELEINEISN